MQDAVGVVDLVDRRRAFRTQPAAARRVQRVALELADLVRFLVDVREQAARRFAIEARRRHQSIVVFDLLRRPLARVDLDHIVPRFRPADDCTGGAGGAVRKRRRLGNQPKLTAQRSMKLGVTATIS